MKLHLRRAALLLPLVLSGCVHRTHQQAQQPLAPPIEDTPLPPPSNAPANLPPPVETKPEPTPPVSTPPAPKPQPATTPPRKTRKSSAPRQAQAPTQPAATQTAPAQQAAANNTPDEVSAVGNLGSGVAPDSRQQTLKSIGEVERGVNAINRKLSDQEQKTSNQIHEYLKQARTALDTGDIDGANNLALKAKVLLGELTP